MESADSYLQTSLFVIFTTFYTSSTGREHKIQISFWIGEGRKSPLVVREKGISNGRMWWSCSSPSSPSSEPTWRNAKGGERKGSGDGRAWLEME